MQQKNRTLSSGESGVLFFLHTAGRATINANIHKTLSFGESGFLFFFAHSQLGDNKCRKNTTLSSGESGVSFFLHTARRPTISAKRIEL